MIRMVVLLVVSENGKQKMLLFEVTVIKVVVNGLLENGERSGI